jgi:formate dehydrogenase beta subunit
MILTRGSFARAGSSLEFNTGDWRIKRPVHVHRIAPCHGACPAGEDPQTYLARMADGDPRAAWQMLVEANPLPAITGRVCHHPCETSCNRAQFDSSVAIHNVERFLGDLAIEKGWEYPVRKPLADAPEVVIVGAGPAGLSAAYHLLMRGCNVTVIEAQPVAGGLLREAIPPYRLPREVVQSEVARLLAAGIKFLPNRRLGRDVSLDELRSSFRAVFLAPGNEKGRDWSVDGVVPNDLRSGLATLKEWSSYGTLPSHKRVAIIGGGNTAIDLARLLRFTGVSEVHVITFQTKPGDVQARESGMSALPRQIEQAIEEGVIVHDRRGVHRLILRGGRAVGVEMVQMKEITLDDGRHEVVSFEGTESVLHVDQVIPAIGQEVNPIGMELLLDNRPFFATDSWGRLPDQSGVLAGGDARGGWGTVSGAIGDGRRAAIAIDSYLKGTPLPAEAPANPITFAELNINYFDHVPRTEIATLSVERRTIETEIESGLNSAQAAAESIRCLSCGECMACDNCWTLCPDNAVLKATERGSDGSHYVFDYDHCKGCGLCAHECPVGYIGMIDEP